MSNGQRRVHMLRTRSTRAGLYKEGKNYPVPHDVASELVDEGIAVYLDAPEPEHATVAPTEDAAKRTKRPKTRRTTRSKATSTGADDE